VICAALAASPVCLPPLHAQTSSLRLEGIVWDPSGNPISGARMTAVDNDSGLVYDTESDSDGYYRFLALPPGVYTVTAKADGLRDVVHRNLYLHTPGGTQENFSFEVSAIDLDVGPTSRIRTLDSDLALSLSRDQLEALPILDRNPLGLAPLQPGVQTNGGFEALSAINGIRPSMHSVRRDGVSATDPVDPLVGFSLVPANLDAVSDLQMISLGATAQYGGSGGAQFLMTSPVGTRTWKGSLYDYVQNDNLNANEFFHNARGIARPENTRHLFGGTLSGPLGDRTRIFGNFEGNRTDRQVHRNRLVLTDTARTGVFRWYRPDTTSFTEGNLQSYDIAGNDPRGLGIDPVVAGLIARTPEPNNFEIGDRLNTGGYQFLGDARVHGEQVNLRIDHDLDARHRLFVRFGWNRTDATDVPNTAEARFPGGESGFWRTNDFNLVAGSDFTLSPTMVNELRVGFTRTSTDHERPEDTLEAMILPQSWDSPRVASFPRSYTSPAFEITDHVSLARNIHVFKFGASLRRTRLGSTEYEGAAPRIHFAPDFGNAPSEETGPSVISEISLEDRESFELLYNELLGRVGRISQTYNSDLRTFLPGGSPRERDFALLEFSGFVEDNWKILRNLTLNLGLRYEITTVPEELNGIQGVLDRAAEITPSARISDFTLRTGDDWYNRPLNNFAPRVGFAWDIFETGSTVLRGSYGIHYNPLIGGVTRFLDRNGYGFSEEVAVYPNTGGTDYRLGDELPMPERPEALNLMPAATRSSSMAVLDRDLATPRVHQFHLTLERRLWGAVWEAGYTGTRGKKLFQFLDLNQPRIEGDFLQAFRELQAYRNSGIPVSESNTLVRIFGTPLAAFDALKGFHFDSGQAGIAADILDRDYHHLYGDAGVGESYLRNFPQFDRFLYGTNAAESWHDALRLGVRKNTYNYNLRAHYTWSKSLDTASAERSTYANAFSPESAKAFSDFHRKHVFHLAFDYALPFGRTPDSDYDFPGWVNALFSGWNIGALWTRTSGARFSIHSGLQTQYSGVYSLVDFDRGAGRSVGSLSTEGGRAYWISQGESDLFSHPEAGQPGNSGRNFFTGPGYSNLDMVLHKAFTFRELHSIQFRLEAYNVLNNTRFALPDTNYSSPNFGSLGSTVGNPRLMQVALRYQF
jgi:hypothetical protein